MKEEWRDIKGYEGKYMVSNLGRVKSLNYNKTGKEEILKGVDNGYGYLILNLYREGKMKTCKVHKLVAQAFLENPEGYKEVNHKDEDKTNNCVENLEWCSRSYNINYGTGNKKRAKKLNKPVFSVDKESGLIMYWESIREAERCTGIANSNICACCNGKKKSAGNHIWFYAD